MGTAHRRAGHERLESCKWLLKPRSLSFDQNNGEGKWPYSRMKPRAQEAAFASLDGVRGEKILNPSWDPIPTPRYSLDFSNQVSSLLGGII